MKDSLKDFIDKNRDAFDHREPSEKVWAAVRSSVDSKTKNLWQSIVVWRVAAAIFFGLTLFLFFNRSGASLKGKEVANLQREFTDLESFYKGQIAEKISFIEDFDNAYEDDLFTQDLQKLDAMYHVLREEMKAGPSEKVKDALILNMLVRIDLLNQQIKKLEDSQKKERGTSI